MPFVATKGADLYYETYGSGPPVVFAHGIGGNHLSWWQQVAHFQGRYTCVVFDHRGFSLSVDRDGRGGHGFIEDLEALLDHLGIGQARLVAQSMGGWTCLGFTLAHPERVRALVMAATTGPAGGEAITRARDANPISRADYLARGIHPAAGERMAKEQPAMHLLYRELDQLSVGLDKERLRAELATMRSAGDDAIRGVTIPVLCISGEEDVVAPPAAIEAFASLLPNGRLVKVPAAGHSVYWERAAVFNEIVDGFFDQV